MQGFRKCALVVSLSIAMALSAAANGRPTTAHSHGSLDDDDSTLPASIITRILDFFEIELKNRFSIPPG